MSAKWYILQVYSNFEDKVGQTLLANSEKEGLSHLVEEVFIPKEAVKQIKNGKAIYVERKLYQGYIYVKIDLTDSLYNVIRDIPRVSGFLGANKSGVGRLDPIPVSEKEIKRIKDVVSHRSEASVSAFSFDVGEKVQVIDGPFQSFSGFVEGVDIERERLKLSISIFNRETPVELEYHQVKKVS